MNKYHYRILPNEICDMIIVDNSLVGAAIKIDCNYARINLKAVVRQCIHQRR